MERKHIKKYMKVIFNKILILHLIYLNMNYDITFCSYTECNNKKCRRNQNNYKMIDEYISIADFSDNCGYLEIMKHKEIKNRRKNQK